MSNRNELGCVGSLVLLVISVVLIFICMGTSDWQPQWSYDRGYREEVCATVTKTESVSPTYQEPQYLVFTKSGTYRAKDGALYAGIQVDEEYKFVLVNDRFGYGDMVIMEVVNVLRCR